MFCNAITKNNTKCKSRVKSGYCYHHTSKNHSSLLCTSYLLKGTMCQNKKIDGYLYCSRHKEKYYTSICYSRQCNKPTNDIFCNKCINSLTRKHLHFYTNELKKNYLQNNQNLIYYLKYICDLDDIQKHNNDQIDNINCIINKMSKEDTNMFIKMYNKLLKKSCFTKIDYVLFNEISLNSLLHNNSQTLFWITIDTSKWNYSSVINEMEDNNKKGKGKNHGDCIICLSDTFDSTLYKCENSKCVSIIHKNCMELWDNSCPLCRT